MIYLRPRFRSNLVRLAHKTVPVQVTKKDKETSQNLVHRFTKTVRQSGVLLQTRKTRFFKRAKSDLAKKMSALRRVKLKAEKILEEKMAKPK